MTFAGKDTLGVGTASDEPTVLDGRLKHQGRKSVNEAILFRAHGTPKCQRQVAIKSGGYFKFSSLPESSSITVPVFPLFKDRMMGHQPYGIDFDEPFRILLVEASLNIHA